MDPRDFDDLIAKYRQVAEAFGTVYRDITGEEFDLEGAVRHYPLVSLGIAAGTGLFAGMWIARRQRQELAPPPPPTAQRPFDYLEHLLPEPFGRMRQVLPEITSEEAASAARDWLDSVEPRLRDAMESTRFGLFLRRAFEGPDEDGRESGGSGRR